MVLQAVMEKQRAISVAAMRERMPHEIHIMPNPLNNEAVLPDGLVSDARTLYRYIDSSDSNDGRTTYKCTWSRRSRPYLEAGRVPADVSTDEYDVIIPGGVPYTLRAGQLAILREIPETVFNITNINQDWQEYIARLSMEDYGLRR